jgi:predicted deacylase
MNGKWYCKSNSFNNRENSMETKSIAGHELTPGKTVKDHIHVEGTELHVPHVLLCGEQPGPTVLISAGIHNAEYVGLQAAIELSNDLDVSELRGKTDLNAEFNSAH